VIKLVNGRRKQVSTLSARRFARLYSTRSKDDVGTITIECGQYKDSDGDRAVYKFELTAIPHAQEAMRLLEKSTVTRRPNRRAAPLLRQTARC
jgi:hypothetical protein